MKTILVDLNSICVHLSFIGQHLIHLNAKLDQHWFRTTVGARQGCILSPTLFNVFLKRIMSDALEEHDGKVSIGGRNITNLRFADDIDALAEEEQELEALVKSLDKTCTRYKNGYQCREDQTDDKLRQWHPERDKG